MKSLEPLILRLHQASMQPNLWPEVILELSDVFGGRPLMYGVQWLPSGISFMKSARMPEDIVQKIVSQYASVSTNPVMQAAVPMMKLHEPLAIDAMVPPEELRRTTYYRETLSQMGGIVGDVAVASHVSPSRLTVLVLARKEDQAPATEDDLDILARLSPHLGLAMEVMVRMGRLHAAYGALDQVLCRVAQPVVLLNSEANIVFSNPALEDLLGLGNKLEVRAGRLHSRASEQDSQLQKFIGALVGETSSAQSERSLTLQANDDLPALSFIGQPIRSDFASTLDLGETRAIVFVSHLGSIRTDLTEALTAYFKLSAQQSRIVGLTLDGFDGPAIAEELSISRNSLKTHMQRIFEKTQTRNRGELFKRLISVAAQTPRLEL